jgi:drug/metabolite transporter (DMT)-like permease
VGIIAMPLLVAGNLPRPGAAWWMVAFSGVAELTGFAAYIYGARGGAAVPAVLASQFAAVAAVGAYLVFRERLAARQIVGAGVILAGVCALTLLRA